MKPIPVRLPVCLAAPFVLALSALAAENKPALPEDLVEYVRMAARLGLAESEIRENAGKAGWPAARVDDALKVARTTAPPAYVPAAETPPPKSERAPAPATSAKSPLSKAPRPEPTVKLPDGYQIGAGDILRIDVWDEPKASVASTVVRPDGRIGMPLLKEVEVLGLSPAEAEQRITERLSALIPGADVTIVVTGINSKKIYVLGGVKKEGPIPYTYRMTVLQALSEAGGLNDYAKRKKIYVLRAQNGKEYRLPFDYDAVLRGERMELNITLQAGDTIIIPR